MTKIKMIKINNIFHIYPVTEAVVAGRGARGYVSPGTSRGERGKRVR